MGLFDRFRKRIHEVADETDGEALSVEADSEEAKAYLDSKEQASSPSEDWEDLDTEVGSFQPADPGPNESDDDWDTWDDDEPTVPLQLPKKERKRLEREERDRERKTAKAMKKRGAVEVSRPEGSRVDLTMMRTTTGRQLVEVQQAPRGGTRTTTIETEAGSNIAVDLGGGSSPMVGASSRLAKPWTTCLRNLNGCCLNPIFHITQQEPSSTASAQRLWALGSAKVLNFPRSLRQRSSEPFTVCWKQAIGILTPPFKALSTVAMFRL